MVKHIVIWNIKATETASKEENIATFKTMLEALPEKIAEIASLEVGIKTEKSPDNNNDIVLTTTHKTWNDLSTYSNHPEHMKVIAFAKTVVETRSAVDYEF